MFLDASPARERSFLRWGALSAFVAVAAGAFGAFVGLCHGFSIAFFWAVSFCYARARKGSPATTRSRGGSLLTFINTSKF